MLWYNHSFIDRNCFSGVRCGPLASCLLFYENILDLFFNTYDRCQRSQNISLDNEVSYPYKKKDLKNAILNRLLLILAASTKYSTLDSIHFNLAKHY